MPVILPDRLPWFVAGPIIGLCVVALYAIANQRMGVTSSYAQVVVLFRDRVRVEAWRLWFFAGMLGGAFVAAILRGGPSASLSYGALGLFLPLTVLIPVLFIAGVFIGYGARWGGGCTSGHGISGTASLSPASLAATATFMGTAVVVTLLLHGLTGGAL